MITQFIESCSDKRITRAEREGIILLHINNIVVIDDEPYKVISEPRLNLDTDVLEICIWKNTARDKK
jgi:hypothetical protein